MRIQGGSSKPLFPSPLEGEGRRGAAARGEGADPSEALDTRTHTGIVTYEPSELFVTARCGTPLADVEAALEARGQMLAFEPPHFGGGATVGGAFAAGLSGPRRMHCGALRDFVLGASVLDGRGRVLRFGGQVMKNVAGYDVSRLLAGSRGTLGVVTEVTFKLLPRPARELTLRLSLGDTEAQARVRVWLARALPVSATLWRDGALWLRLSASEAGVRAARAVIGGETAAESDTPWRAVRDHAHPFFAGDGELWRLSLPPTSPAPDAAGAQLVEWGGALRWLRPGPGTDAARIRAAVRAAGGHATRFRRGAASGDTADAFDALPPAALALHRRLKRVFDPAGVFGPGCLHPEP